MNEQEENKETTAAEKCQLAADLFRQAAGVAAAGQKASALAAAAPTVENLAPVNKWRADLAKLTEQLSAI